MFRRREQSPKPTSNDFTPRIRTKVVAGRKLSREFAQKVKWVPIFGDIVKVGDETFQGSTTLFWGIDQEGNKLPLNERAKQAFIHQLKAEGWKVKTVISFLFLIGAPEMAIARLAAVGVKGAKMAKVTKVGAKAGKYALKARKAKELAEDIGNAVNAVKQLHQEGISWEVAAKIAPRALDEIASNRLKRQPAVALAMKLTAKILRSLPEKETAAIIAGVPRSDDKKVAQDIHEFAKVFNPV